MFTVEAGHSDLRFGVDLIGVAGLFRPAGVSEDRGEGCGERSEGSGSDGQHPGSRTPLMTNFFFFFLNQFYFSHFC